MKTETEVSTPTTTTLTFLAPRSFTFAVPPTVYKLFFLAPLHPQAVQIKDITD